MTTRRIFNKRRSKKIIFITISFFLIFSSFLIFYTNFIKGSDFVLIPENLENFYIIPTDRGGEKVANLDKKSLNLISQQTSKKLINKPEELYFSIQIFSNNDLENLSNYLEKITNSRETIYSLENFYILALNTEIGIEYFLLYKNFETRDGANDYCLNFLQKIDKCLVIDTTKF